MFMAELDTRHFVFHAFGDTEALALDAMRETWQTHAEETGACDFSEMEDSVIVLEITSACGYRDYEPLRKTPNRRIHQR